MNVVAFPAAGADPRIVTLLISVSKLTRAMVGLRLAEIGLSAGEDNILMCVDVRKPVEASDLARSLGIRFSTLQRSVDHLIAEGYLERRDAFVKLTEKGQALLPRITAARVSIANDLEVSEGTEVVGMMIGSLELIEDKLIKLLTPAA
jgi:DNA-binding MarR family transcriptional regulator